MPGVAHARSEVVVTENSATTANSRRVLVVDDADELRELYSLGLEHAGYEVKVAALAEAALETMRSWRPDLVITDVFMPGIGGLELVTRIRSDLRPPIPKVIVISRLVASSRSVFPVGADAAEILPPLDEHDLAILALADAFEGLRERLAAARHALAAAVRVETSAELTYEAPLPITGAEAIVVRVRELLAYALSERVTGSERFVAFDTRRRYEPP